MPRHTTQQYLEKANHNGQFARELQLSSIQSPEWAIVGAFYSAVHYVNAYLVQTNYQIEPDNHKQRNWYVATVSQLKPINRAYQRLSDKAWEARYTMSSFQQEFAQELIDRDLVPIEGLVQSLLV